jgi:hypothetical protein
MQEKEDFWKIELVSTQMQAVLSALVSVPDGQTLQMSYIACPSGHSHAPFMYCWPEGQEGATHKVPFRMYPTLH